MTYSFRTNGNFIDFVHTDSTSLHIETVLRSLDNTSRAVSWSLTEDESTITFKFDDIEVRDFQISEIDFDGTVMTTHDDFETNITAMFPGLEGGGEAGSQPYLVYKGYINQQTSTDAPTLQNPQNTLGIVVWTRNGVGDYRGTSDGLFKEFKTFMPPFDLTGYTYLPISNASFFDYGYKLNWESVNEVSFKVYDNTFTPVDLESIVGSTGMIPIEIQVYP